MADEQPELFTTRVILGDHSEDGHCRQATVLIRANATTTDISDAWAEFSAASGVPIADLCDDYDASSIGGEQLARVLSRATTSDRREALLGCLWLDDDYGDRQDLDTFLARITGGRPVKFQGAGEYLMFLMLCAEVVRPGLKWSIVVPEYSGTIVGLGYGLF